MTSVSRTQPQRPPATAADAPLGREVWIVAGVVVIGVFMSILDTTIVNVALATLARELHSSLTTIQWVATGYLLSLAIVIPLSGWMSERFGSKRIWMVSVAMMPTMAAAFAQLRPPQVPRATAALNALQRTGGSIGTALLAVVLTHEIAQALGGAAVGGSVSFEQLSPAVRARVAEPLASAFGSTFWWAVAITALAIVPAAVLAVRERGARRQPGVVAPPA